MNTNSTMGADTVRRRSQWRSRLLAGGLALGTGTWYVLSVSGQPVTTSNSSGNGNGY